MKSVRIYQYSFSVGLILGVIVSCSEAKQNKAQNITYYSQDSCGTRRLEWDDNQGIGWIKILLEAANFGVQGIEVAEMYFPPGYQDVAHMHELELLYVLEGKLDHIVNGASHILEPGMLGVVKKPNWLFTEPVQKTGFVF